MENKNKRVVKKLDKAAEKLAKEISDRPVVIGQISFSFDREKQATHAAVIVQYDNGALADPHIFKDFDFKKLTDDIDELVKFSLESAYLKDSQVGDINEKK